MASAASVLLEVKSLRTRFRNNHGDIYAVNSVSFDLSAGEVLGVVGESGSGKSVTMMSLIRLLPVPPAVIEGECVRFAGKNLLTANEDTLRAMRGAGIGIVFQDPMTSLNPVLTIGYQIMEPLRLHLGMNRRQARARAAELLELVGISDGAARLSDYPHQFSGGMRQRVMIAIAIACEPRILIADEPTTALDVTIQAQIIQLIKGLREKLEMAIIWITHDLGVVAGIADRLLVMYGGQIVEEGPVRELYANPRHPYTRALMKTIPAMRGPRAQRLRVIEGQPPILRTPPAACSFRNRCAHAFERCGNENPRLRELAPGHSVACFWYPQTGGPNDG